MRTSNISGVLQKGLRAVVSTACVAVTALAGTLAMPAQAALAACPPDQWYVVSSDQGNVHVGVGAPQANYNATPNPATSTFSAQVSGTVSLAVSTSESVSGSIIIADAEVQLGINLSVSLTATLGNNISTVTPPWKTTHAAYGVWRKKTNGTYWKSFSNCTMTSVPVTAWSPYYVGWRIWQT